MYSSSYFSKLWRKFGMEIIIVGITIISIIVSAYFIYVSLQIPQETIVKAEQVATAKNVQTKITIEVSGAVMSPGVFTVKTSSRIIDALSLAGGLNDYAAKEFVARNFNLTLPLKDMQKIHVPSYYEVNTGIFNEQDRYLSYLSIEENQLPPPVKTPHQPEKVNVNISTVTELDELPGIGPKTAEKIVENRPFSGREELLQKKVISDSLMKQIENLIDY